MSILDRILGRSKDKEKSGSERPPKPDEYEDSYKREKTRYKATIEYRNGDTETFECYGVYSRGDDYIQFNTDPYGRVSAYSHEASYSYDRREEHYEVLAREPVLEEVATDEFVIEYRAEWKWMSPNGLAFAGNREWCEVHEDVELSVVWGVGDE